MTNPIEYTAVVIPADKAPEQIRMLGDVTKLGGKLIPQFLGEAGHMGDAIAHPSHAAPRYLGMVSDEFAVHNPGGGLADNNGAHHHGLLGAVIGKKSTFS